MKNKKVPGKVKQSKFGNKPIFKAKQSLEGANKTRKELRKDKRQAKKKRQQQHVLNKFGKKTNTTPSASEHFTKQEDIISPSTEHSKQTLNKKKIKKKSMDSKKGPPPSLTVVKKCLEKEMQTHRMKQMQLANKEEDKNIKKLAKQLKMNRRKSKSMPKVFATEGLDYLLDVCDPEKLKLLSKDKDALESSGSEFEDDFAAITGRKKIKSKNEENSDMSESCEDSSGSDQEEENMSLGDDEEEEIDEDLDDESGEETETSEEDIDMECELTDEDTYQTQVSKENTIKNKHLSLDDDDDDDDPSKIKSKKKESSKKQVRFQIKETPKTVPDDKSTKKKQKIKPREIGYSENSEEEGSDEEFDEDIFGSEEEVENEEKEHKEEKSEYWEDIYGRKRDKKGNIVLETGGRYIPPALRAGANTDAAKLLRLKRQMQGLLNRVAESNMGSVASQLEELIAANSRGDCNQVLGQLLLAALVPAHANTPSKLAAEHALLLALLHAHVGAEIGATFLQTAVTTFDKCYSTHADVENKTLNNLLLIICFMYSFKMFHCVLVFDILKKLSDEFKEKDVELIMLILKTVGPSLRKDDPAALKEIILQLQKQASAATQHKENTRVKFMLDILLAIKNNNMSRIPDYDPELVDHLRKVLRALLRTNYQVSELKISLQDLLMAEERGRWWVVGSAWQGTGPGTANSEEQQSSTSYNFSQQILELARKQRMNTDVRKNVFCILMTAEDYLDAFEKLLRLSLKGSQEREISYVMLDCCLQEKSYNPYYGHLSQKFCDFDRKYRMSVQCSVWDKIQELSNLSAQQLRNLASFVSQLVLSNGITLAVLKVIQFADLEKKNVKFVRQILLGVLLDKNEEASSAAFHRIPSTDQLALFRESLNMFLLRYVLSKKDQLPAGSDTELLTARIKMAEKALLNADRRVAL